MDLDLGYLSKGLTKRSIMGQCGGSMTSSETAVDDFAMNMVNDYSTTQVISISKCYSSPSESFNMTMSIKQAKWHAFSNMTMSLHA